MALSRTHTSAKAADPARILLLVIDSTIGVGLVTGHLMSLHNESGTTFISSAAFDRRLNGSSVIVKLHICLAAGLKLRHFVAFCFEVLVINFLTLSLQCFDTVGWATTWAFGL